MSLPPYPVWPFKADWTSPIVEAYEWLTNVHKSRDGTEQRQCLRQTPRRRLDYPIQVYGSERTFLDVFLMKNQGARWFVPVPSESILLTYDFAPGDTALPVPLGEPVNQFYVGQACVIADGVYNAEVVEVTSVAPDVIGVTPLTKAYRRGSIFSTAFIGTITDTVTAGRKTGGVYTATVRFEADQPFPRLTSAWSGLMYMGLPVLTTPPNSANDLDYTYDRPLSVVDNKTSIPRRRDDRGYTTAGQRHEFLMYGNDERFAFIDFLYRLKGQLNPLWVPTFNDDLPARAGWPDPDGLLDAVPYRNTAIEFRRDGTHTIRAAISGGIAPPNVYDDVSEIASTSFMSIKRLNVDSVEFSHQTNRISTAALVFVDVGGERLPYGYYKNPYAASDPNASAQPPLDFAGPVKVFGPAGGQA